MSETCQRLVRVLSETFQRLVRDLTETCQRLVRDLSETCHLSETCQRLVRDLSETFKRLVRLWIITITLIFALLMSWPTLVIESIEPYLFKEPIYYQSIVASRVPLRAFYNCLALTFEQTIFQKLKVSVSSLDIWV